MSDAPIEDLEEIAASLQEVFPDLPNVAPVTFLTRGANSVVVESQSGHLFRVGRNRKSFQSYQKEVQLLPLIRDKVRIPVPAPDWVSGPTSAMDTEQWDTQSFPVRR